ncbi:MAG TPA: hypothetical protein VG247_21235 [Pseudonocardiaceae bacterium]|jgi:hypothetical protein|nr:hypothetical protein [Pseudonocardiaceae bacterium]
MSRWRREIAENLRQRGQHAAFRIEPPAWDEPQRRQLAELLDQLAEPVSDEAEPVLDESALVATGNGLWQARTKLGGSTDDPKRTRQVNRYLGNTEKALAKLGLVVQDHTGDRYHSGLSLEVIAMVDDVNVAEETVVETIRPSIYLGGRTLQLGQVVVAFPPDKENPRA